jgi:hypothetical protein
MRYSTSDVIRVHAVSMSNTQAYLSDGRLFLIQPDGKEQEIKSTFVVDLQKRLQSIKERREWKASGSGAQFARGGLPVGGQYEVDRFNPRFSAGCPAVDDHSLYYAIDAGDVHGIFQYDIVEKKELRLTHGPDRRFSWLAAHPDGEQLAVAIHHADGTGSIGIMNPSRSGGVREITEGDSVDSYPAWVPGDGRSLVFQSSGVARRNGDWAGLGPASIQMLNLDTGAIDSLVEDPNSDFLCPSYGVDGKLYFIQRPYESVVRTKPLDSLKDIVLFPFRLVRALLAFLNVFSVFFSGKPLKTAGGPKRVGPDPKAVFLYGRWLQLQQATAPGKEDEPSSNVPSSWVLKRLTPGSPLAQAEVVATGVMAYTAASDGSVYYSTGNHVYQREKKSSPQRVSKLSLVTCLIVR